MNPVTTVRSGSVRIPIFPFSQGGYQARFVDPHGKAIRWTSRDLEKLKERCRKEAKKMQAGIIDLDQISPAEAALCREVLRRGITLGDLDRLDSAPAPVLLSSAVEEFLDSKRQSAGRSERHWRSLSSHLRGFARSMPAKQLLGTITPRQIDAWLAKAKTTRTRKNKRGSVVTFFRWAKRKNLLAPDRDTAAERSEPVRVESDRVALWTPDDLRTMLEHVRADYLPWIVIQAFAGVRTAELFPEQRAGSRKDPLRWENVYLDREAPFIEVPFTCSKTGDRRIIPVCPALLAWLRPISKASGRVCPAKAPSRRNHSEPTIIEHLEKHVGPWRRNALRHSFGSYRTAQCRHMGEVSLEMGNSIPTIKRHYYEAVTAEDAAAWFGLTPDLVDRSMRATG